MRRDRLEMCPQRNVRKENAERILHRHRVDQLQKERDAAHRAWVKAAGKKEERRAARRAFLDAAEAPGVGRRLR